MQNGQKFGLGTVLSLLALWFFFDSVRVSTGSHGFFSGYMFNQFHGGNFSSTSMGLILVPFFIGMVALAYDATKKWAWWLMYSGIGIIVIEMLSRIRFVMNMKSSHLLILIVMFATGVGLILKSFNAENTNGCDKTDKS